MNYEDYEDELTLAMQDEAEANIDPRFDAVAGVDEVPILRGGEAVRIPHTPAPMRGQIGMWKTEDDDDLTLAMQDAAEANV